MLTGNGLARRVHIALIVLLVLGVAGSFWMSVRAQATARDAVAEQAEALVDSSLTLVFDPEDLQRDLPSERIRELTHAIDDVVFDPSDFESVILYASNGEIPLLDRGREHRPAADGRALAHQRGLPR